MKTSFKTNMCIFLSCMMDFLFKGVLNAKQEILKSFLGNFLNQFCLHIYQWLAGQQKAMEVQEKKWRTSFTIFLFKHVLIAKHELSSLENIWVHANVDLFEPILHIYQCLAGWKKQIIY